MTQPVYPNDYEIQAQLNGVWTDISNYVVGDIDAAWGISGNGPLALVADTGTLDLVLNNSTGMFTPDGPSVMSGWKIGIGMRVIIFYISGGAGRAVSYVRWKGTIKTIKPPSGRWEDFRVRVHCVDWMDYAAELPLVNPGILADQRGDEVISLILGLLPALGDRNLDVGVNVFPTAFDTVTSHTKGLSEFAKVAFSEGGYVTLLKDRVYGETLRFENYHRRNGLRQIDTLSNTLADYLLKEDGGKLLKEDGGRLIRDTEDSGGLVINNAVRQIDLEYGENIINHFTVYANPRKIDTTPQVLFTLAEPIVIGSGQEIEIKGNYVDPNGGAPINAQNMIAPVPNTDYKVWTNQNGTGTDITMEMEITIGYGAEGFTHKVKNLSSSGGWIFPFNCRGYGIYLYNPIEHVETDSDSKEEFGVMTEAMDQKYQVQLIHGTEYAKKVVELERQPRTVVHAMHFVANTSDQLMRAFLSVDCGFLFRAIDTKYNIDSLFFVQGVQFKIKPGGLIAFEWIVKEFWSLLLGLDMIAIEFGTGTGDAINFGLLSQVSDLQQRTISAWIYVDTDTPATGLQRRQIVAWGVGYMVSIRPNRKLRVYQIHTGAGNSFGIWETPTNSVPLSAWTHVVVLHDTTDVTADPVIYINNSVQTLTEVSTPAGAVDTNEDDEFVVGNSHSANDDYTSTFDGKMKDVRIYNRVLSSGEVATLYNSGTPNEMLVTSGMVFQAFCVRTKELSQYINLNLTKKVLEQVYGAVGTPHGDPVVWAF